VHDKAQQAQRGARGGQRGRGEGRGRGGRGGDRPRGDRPPREEGDAPRRGRGEGRGGRGDRPRTAKPTHAVEGVEGVEAVAEEGQQVQRGGRGGRGPRHQGKAREDAHPMDRQDGTGRGRRGDKKDGHGKGNWGKDKEAADADNQEEKKEERPRREPREKKEEKVEEPVVEEEEVGFTLDDYMNAKKAKATGIQMQKAGRDHEKLDQKNIKGLESDKAAQQEKTKIYTKIDTVATRPNAGAELLGFQASADQGDEFESRGARGGRGGRREERPRTDAKPQRGGRKGGKIVVDDNEFPTL